MRPLVILLHNTKDLLYSSNGLRCLVPLRFTFNYTIFLPLLLNYHSNMFLNVLKYLPSIFSKLTSPCLPSSLPLILHTADCIGHTQCSNGTGFQHSKAR